MQRIPTRAVRFGLSLVSLVVACSSAASRTRLPSSTGGSVGLTGSGPGAATGRGGQSGQPGSTSTGGLTSSDGATSSTVIASSGGSGGNSGSTTPVSPGAIETSLDLPPRRQA